MSCVRSPQRRAAPVYGTHETYFGTGIAAGSHGDPYTNRGRMAAERLMQLAAGETIPVLSARCRLLRG